MGGGREFSLSLLEATQICAELTGNQVRVSSNPETRAGDIPVYLSDCGLLFSHSHWRPLRDPNRVLADIYEWIDSNRETLARFLER